MGNFYRRGPDWMVGEIPGITEARETVQPSGPPGSDCQADRNLAGEGDRVAEEWRFAEVATSARAVSRTCAERFRASRN